MKSLFPILCSASVVLLSGSLSAQAQAPANDLFVNAITLNGPIVTTTGSNVGATKQFGGGGGGEPSIGGGLGNFGGASVWWNWTATASGETTIDTEGSDFNTLLGVWTGEAQNALTIVAGNDNFEANTWSRVTFNAVGGTTYRIMVDGFRSGPGFGSPATGNIKLNVKGVGGIEVLSPTKGGVYTFGDPVPVTIAITPDFPNPPAGVVNFFANGLQFASLSAPPYSAMASNLPAGSNTVWAVAINSVGAPIKSPEVKILVQNVGVTMLTPPEDTMYLSTSPIAMTAWTFLPAGTFTSVDFLVDGVKVAESTAATPPHIGIWENPVGGSHRLTAVGRTDSGARFTSQAVNIGVATTLVSTGAVWKYLDIGADLGTAWIQSGFDDSSWASGPGELGYGDGDEATVVASGPANAFYITTYFRKTVTIGDVAGFAALNASLERDDAAVVYLNGREVFRTSNLPAAPTPVLFDTVATGQAVEDTIDTFRIDPTNFVAGANVFAVEVHQQAANSSDVSFNFSLQAIPVIIKNLSPNVDLTSPTNTQFFLAPPSITLDATASDADGSVAKVEFFANGVKIGEDSEAPYSVVWNNPPVRAHIVTAVATDDQGASTTSAEALVVVYDATGTPVGAVTSPVDGFITQGPTNWTVTATANAVPGVASVQFLNNGVPFGTDDTAPYSAVWVAPFGTNVLTVVVTDRNGAVGTSPAVTAVITIPPTNVIAPTVASQAPLAGASVSNLTSITVTFSEFVQGIDASDLLVNGVPATGVNAANSRTNYTFTFAEPPYGAVNITWAADNGITDYGWPTLLPFDRTGASATWSYTLVDKTLPTVAARVPAANAIVTNLNEISVTFTEPVTGVDAADLLVNGTPALGVTGSGINYTFNVPTPASSGTTVVNVTWATNSAILDLALAPNTMNPAATNNTWRFVYDPRVSLVQSNATWRFVKGLTEASDPISAWRQKAFDDSSWSNAPAPFFFGDPYTNAAIRGTLLSDMQSNYTTIFLRKEFFVANRGEILSLQLNHQTDDGFIAWLNGVEVLRYNVPSGANGDLPYNTNAVNAANEPGNAGAAYIVATLTNNAVARLVNGTNTLAIQAFNQNLTNSSDFGFNAQLYYFPIDPSTVPPRVVSTEPAGGDVYALDHVTFSFSEGVTNVAATNLLINGVPAVSVTSTTNSIYTFHFPQPPYGAVAVRWATNEAVVDFDNPPRPFDGQAAAASVDYVLLNPSTPRLIVRQPAPSTTLTGLTSVTITFDEPVTGLDASDLLVSGAAATAVQGLGATNFVFTFPQPAFGTVSIRWATNHGITDLSEPPAPFYPNRFGHEWNYTLIDPVPTITLTSPTNNTFFLPPATITVRATASDNDGTVAQVTLYQGDSVLATFTNVAANYSVGVSNLDLGQYSFRGIVSDNQGLLRTSAPVVINVVTSLPITLVRGPYLQMGSTNAATIRWRTQVVSDGLVYYGTDPANLTNIARGLSALTNNHVVRLTGLETDTKYYYSIGSAAFRLVGGEISGNDYWFKTTPPVGTRRPTRFWVLGDAGTAGNGSAGPQSSTRDAYYRWASTNGPADLWLMLGDNAYNSGTDSEHQAAVFDMYPNTLRNLFLWPTIGNHETSQSTTATDFPYLDIFSLPTAGEAGGVASGTEKYYSFDYGNIHFVCLDSMTSGLTGTTPMANWLRNDLESTTAEWIIVFFHHPPYTKGSHNSDTEQDLVAIRQNLNPILESYGVDLVLSGHSHAYERSYLINGHYGLSTTMTDSMKLNAGNGREDEDGAYAKSSTGEGTVYTVAGSSGQATFATTPDGTFAVTNHPAMHFSVIELGSMVIDISENRLDAIFLRETGQIRDRFTLLKPDPRPAAPQGILAVASGTGQITVSWTPGSGNQDNFVLERSADGINFAEIVTTASEVTSYVDEGLALNATFYYRTRGVNGIGAGAYSAVASASTVVPTSTPRAPAGLIVTANDGVRFFRSQVVIRWQDRSTNESSFQIERSLDGTQFTPVATVAANVTTYVDRGLDSATFHYYRVRAVNALGVSAPSVIAGDETHPQSQLARAGDSVVFHAGSEAQGTPRYQWRFMGASLPGETNESLVLPSVDPTEEGDYTVVVWDNSGRQESHPAYLFVVSAPAIITQPEDRVALVGNSTSFSVGAVGTQPTLYQWYHNGTLIPGATAPTLTLTGIQPSSQGAYELVISNEFGEVTSRAATLSVFGRPVFAPIAPFLAEVLSPVTLPIQVSDPNSPKLDLRYSLGGTSPTNASINPTNGVLQWTPARSQAPGQYEFTVIATDATRSDLSVSTTFQVSVIHYIEITSASFVMNSGESNSIPLTIVSTAPLTGFHLKLQVKQSDLRNLVIQEIQPDKVSMTVDRSDPSALTFHFSALAGQTIEGTMEVARLNFRSTADQLSALIDLVPLTFTYERLDAAPGERNPTLILNSGRVVILGNQPIIEARMVAGRRQLFLYGRTGSNYTVQSKFSLAPGNAWTSRGTVTMTNAISSFPAPSPAAPIIFFQLRQ